MAFRRINVDQYDEDHSISANDLIPENPLSDDDLIAKVQATASQVRSLLQRGDTHSALAAVISVQPYGTSPALAQAKVSTLSISTFLCHTYIRQPMLRM
jgi:ARP2/3 complex 16 kDa subunit (p16-Arc)